MFNVCSKIKRSFSMFYVVNVVIEYNTLFLYLRPIYKLQGDLLTNSCLNSFIKLDKKID